VLPERTSTDAPTTTPSSASLLEGCWSVASDPLELILSDRAGWRRWLTRNHDHVDGVWLVLAKKDTSEPTRLRYDDALDEALCFGWIDGQVQRRDAATYRQRFTPRRRASPWSKRNVGIAERLMSQGQMTAAGLAEIERARADGRWAAAYAGPATAEVPADLQAALDAAPRAAAMFAVLTSQNRYAVIRRVLSAKRPETRARKIAEFVAMLTAGDTPYPQRRGRDE
jgi:uncharacterized protein YdeI (YjbR/CyaY-like superfamily)